MGALTNIDLDNILLNHPLTTGSFLGCFACDDLPSDNLRSGASLIINWCDSKSSGCHWLAVHRTMPGKSIEVFDSTGLPSHRYNPHIAAYVARHGLRVVFNKKQLQGFQSIHCGRHAALFIVYRKMKKTMKQIVEKYGENQSKNDRIVVKQFQKMFPRAV